jgi:hypothetical protein
MRDVSEGAMSDAYEFVGHNFWARSTDLALQHGFAFSISLRLPSGSHWVAYYIWLEKGTPSQMKNINLLGKLSIIARGAHAVALNRLLSRMAVPGFSLPLHRLPGCKPRHARSPDAPVV